MKRRVGLVLSLALLPVCVSAVDGLVLINQSTLNSAGGTYQITQPGSYRLSGNLTVTKADRDAIEINSDNVTLDLNGFTIGGPVICTGSPPNCTGVGRFGVSSSNQNSSVKNGVIRGFAIGLFLTGSGLVEDLQTSGNSDTGIIANGVFVVARCLANNNGGTGMAVSGASISDSTSSGNGQDGFQAGSSTLIHTAAIANSRFGLDGSQGVLFGSNTFLNNLGGDLAGGALSQNNNLCTHGSC
jgi:hypothetical protein